MARKIVPLALVGLLIIPVMVFSGSDPPAPPTTTTGSLAISPDGRTLLAANADSNTLSIIDLTSETVTAEIPVGIDPRAVALDPDGARAFTADQGSDTVSVVDITTGTRINQVTTGDRPFRLALSPSGGLLAVAELGADQVRLLDPGSLETLALIPTLDRPAGLAFTPDGRRLLVTHLLRGEVTVIQLDPYDQYLPLIERSALLTGPLSFPGALSAPTGVSAALAGFAAQTDGSNPHRQLVPSRSQGPSPDLRPPISNKQSPIPHTQHLISTWPHIAPAPAVVVNTAGTRAYLPQTMANGLGLNTQFDTTVFPKVSVLDLAAYTHLTAEHISLPETDQPVGLPWAAALAKNGTELWVVNAASQDVSVIDISNPTLPARVANIPVGSNPRGIAFRPDKSAAYVYNSLDGTVSVIDTATYAVSSEIKTTTIPLPPLLLEGKRLFYSSAQLELAQAGWIGCATCHIEGEHDGRTWQLQFLGDLEITAGQVITRNTTSLLGMIQTYPLRWSSEWDESADSEFAVRFEQFGAGLIAGEMHPTLGAPNQGRSSDLDSLAAFIDSLPAPARSHSLTPTELAGRDMFFSPDTGCADCHPPPYYTDFQVHDVGTADAAWEGFGPEIDTPTLRFLNNSAPYLHDGSAQTLLDVLTTANPENEHGVTSSLSAEALADLIAFLMALPYE